MLQLYCMQSTDPFDDWWEEEHSDTSIPYTSDPDVDECEEDQDFDDIDLM